MTATRKSDYVGDQYGDWNVVERADALEGKRRWLVKSVVTGEIKIVLQTELKSLARTPTCVVDEAGVRRNDVGQRIHGDDDPIYVPAGLHAESSQIALAVIDWTRGMPVEPYSRPDDECVFVTCLADPNMECEGRCPAPETEVWDWTATVPVDDGLYDLIEKAGGLGECAEPEVSEEALDGRSAAAPQDPVRAAIRATMSATVGLREALQDIQAAAVALAGFSDALATSYVEVMEKLDQTLKASITR